MWEAEWIHPSFFLHHPKNAHNSQFSINAICKPKKQPTTLQGQQSRPQLPQLSCCRYLMMYSESLTTLSFQHFQHQMRRSLQRKRPSLLVSKNKPAAYAQGYRRHHLCYQDQAASRRRSALPTDATVFHLAYSIMFISTQNSTLGGPTDPQSFPNLSYPSNAAWANEEWLKPTASNNFDNRK